MQKKPDQSLDRENEEDEKEKKPPKEQTAQEIAEIMVANMTANQQDPNFLQEQELLKDKVRRKIIKQRNERKEKGD
jgi:hypothetical protein